MPLTEILALLGASLLAGGMNAIAGGGTILTFPALLAFGMPAIQANATSTVALMLGIVGSTYGYRAHLAKTRVWLKRFGVVSVIGGLMGAALLTITPEKVFAGLVPFLLLFATVLFMAQSMFRKLAAEEAASTPHGLLAIALQFFVALYGGFFGAGIGILMLAVFGLMGLKNIHEMNTLKTILSALINLVAAIYFVFAGLVMWPQAIVMTIGSTFGYFFGSHLTQKISQATVRKLIVAIGLTVSALLFLERMR
jgi:uncharacterized membrane protein YfcA